MLISHDILNLIIKTIFLSHEDPWSKSLLLLFFFILALTRDFDTRVSTVFVKFPTAIIIRRTPQVTTWWPIKTLAYKLYRYFKQGQYVMRQLWCSVTCHSETTPTSAVFNNSRPTYASNAYKIKNKIVCEIQNFLRKH